MPESLQAVELEGTAEGLIVGSEHTVGHQDVALTLIAGDCLSSKSHVAFGWAVRRNTDQAAAPAGLVFVLERCTETRIDLHTLAGSVIANQA